MDEVRTFFNSDDFETMLSKVAADDVVSFKNNNAWLANHPSTAIIFSDTENTWNQLKTSYFSTFADLVYGELPTEVQVLNSLNKVAERLKVLNWRFKTANNEND